jgi:DNA end-binding protein Ku
MAARAIWKGSISFGLVSIPVGLFSAETRDEISFRQLDKKNLAPVGYRKYNKESGEEVETENIVKGYEYEEDRYVLISDEDLRRANPEKTQTVEITDFVDLHEIEPTYYDKPYYLGPLGRVLLLEILRYPYEIRGTEDLELPGEDLKELKVSDRELDMAQMLIDSLTSEWDPEKYHDTYRDDLMALIKKKIESGQTEVIDDTPAPEVEPRTDVIDIMALLKKSVEATSGGRRRAADTAEDDEDEDDDRPAKERKAPAKAAKPKAPSKPKSGSKTAKPRARPRKSA